MTLAIDKLAFNATDATSRPSYRDHHGRQRALGRASAACRAPRATARASRASGARFNASHELGIPHLTLFSFSSENWSRPRQEINDLFGLLRRFIRRDLADLHKNGVRIRVIGTRAGLEPDLLRLIDDAVELTKDNTSLNLTIAFNYGARDEIAQVPRAASRRTLPKASSMPSEVTPECFATYLDTADVPDPDLLIRTSGELRLSNFLLWQVAYSEFVFSDCYWPDFSREHLEAALAEYQRRNRRFGGTSARSTA